MYIQYLIDYVQILMHEPFQNEVRYLGYSDICQYCFQYAEHLFSMILNEVFCVKTNMIR